MLRCASTNSKVMTSCKMSDVRELNFMNMNDYQNEALGTAVFPPQQAIQYLTLGLMNEAGEVGGKIKKYLRGDYGFDELQERISGELGDVLWYLAVLTDELELDLSAIAAENLLKLRKRKAAGTLKGDGDTR